MKRKVKKMGNSHFDRRLLRWTIPKLCSWLPSAIHLIINNKSQIILVIVVKCIAERRRWRLCWRRNVTSFRWNCNWRSSTPSLSPTPSSSPKFVCSMAATFARFLPGPHLHSFSSFSLVFIELFSISIGFLCRFVNFFDKIHFLLKFFYFWLNFRLILMILFHFLDYVHFLLNNF